MKRPSRDPGPEIKRQLRREVNFGCPIRYPNGNGCGCPILVFHHFDPPWVGHYIHNPSGMIALCPTHHGQADGNIWTNEQLRLFKAAPFVDNILRTPWPWSAETLVIKVGPSLVMGSGSPIRLDGLPILRFYPQAIEGLGNRTIVIDSDIRDVNKQRWLRITDGWFDLNLEKTTEVIFTPQTKTFMARHDDQTFVSFRFVKKRLDEFKEWVTTCMTNSETAANIQKTIEIVRAVDTDGMVPVVVMEGKFRTDKIALDINADRMHIDFSIPGHREEFDCPSLVVDDEHRLILRIENGPEFFSLG
jgi:hypothetical protein